jgi:dTDP-4-amino-4,6-dideoxygalactose transaminase
MSNICAAIGRGQIQVLDSHVHLRRKMHQFYVDLFKDVEGVTVFTVPSNNFFSNYWLSTVLIDPTKTVGITREKLRLVLAEANIESRPLWKPMHLQPVFSGFPYYGQDTAETLFNNGLCLPSGSNLTEADRNRIKRVVLNLFVQ